MNTDSIGRVDRVVLAMVKTFTVGAGGYGLYPSRIPPKRCHLSRREKPFLAPPLINGVDKLFKQTLPRQPINPHIEGKDGRGCHVLDDLATYSQPWDPKGIADAPQPSDHGEAGFLAQALSTPDSFRDLRGSIDALQETTNTFKSKREHTKNPPRNRWNTVLPG